MITVGNYPQYKLALAREKKRDYLSILAEGKDLKEYLDSLKKKSTQELSLEVITRTWLEQYAAKKSLDEETKRKRIRKFENHMFLILGICK